MQGVLSNKEREGREKWGEWKRKRGGRKEWEEEGQWRRKQKGEGRGKEDAEEGEEWEKEVKGTEGERKGMAGQEPWMESTLHPLPRNVSSFCSGERDRESLLISSLTVLSIFPQVICCAPTVCWA